MLTEGDEVTDAVSIRLVVLCKSPEFMHVTRGGGGSEFGTEDGYVVYDVLLRRGG